MTTLPGLSGRPGPVFSFSLEFLTDVISEPLFRNVRHDHLRENARGSGCPGSSSFSSLSEELVFIYEAIGHNAVMKEMAACLVIFL